MRGSRFNSRELEEERSDRLRVLGNMREDLLKHIYYRESGVIF